MTVISKETFRQIQIHKNYGVTQRETARRVGVSSETVRRWWNRTAEEFEKMATASPYYLDQYREFILSVLRICPQIRVTNMMYKLKVAFPDFECSRAAFYRYMKMLREQYGFAELSRQTGIRDALPPGHEAQVDFGQYKMKDMYDRTIRIEEKDELLLFYNAETDTFVHKCRRANEAGEFVKHNLAEPHELVAENNLLAKYGDFEAARIFIEMFSREEPRYKTPQLQRIQIVSQTYTDAQMLSIARKQAYALHLNSSPFSSTATASKKADMA